MKILPLLVAAAFTAAPPAAADPLSDAIRADMPQLMTLYRDLHSHPELSMQEVRTPALLAGEMRKLGFAVTEHVGKTGVVAVMKNGPGPTLLIRADMDGGVAKFYKEVVNAALFRLRSQVRAPSRRTGSRNAASA